jgi:hypothetical protein
MVTVVSLTHVLTARDEFEVRVDGCTGCGGVMWWCDVVVVMVGECGDSTGW